MSFYAIRRRSSILHRGAVSLLLATALVVFVLTSTASAATPESFTDVDTMHPYFEAIEGMYAASIIDGYLVGDTREFRPDDTVKRAQFAKMIVNTLNLSVSEADVCPFGDVEKSGEGNLYPDNYIAVAAANGITNGIREGEFGPYESITRAQVMTMAIRAAQSITPGRLADPMAGFVAQVSSFSPTHEGNLRIAEYNGLTFGLVWYGSIWDPWAPATRGEVAQVLWNLRTYQRQTKGPEGVVTITSRQTSDLEPEIAAFLRQSLGAAIQPIRELVCEHPVNASRSISVLLVRSSGKEFVLTRGDEGEFLLNEVHSNFIISPKRFYGGLGTGDFLGWKLSGPFTRQGAETSDAYLARVHGLMSDLENEHGVGRVPQLGTVVDPAGMTDLLSASDEAWINSPLTGGSYSLWIVYSRAAGDAAIIERLATIFYAG